MAALRSSLSANAGAAMRSPTGLAVLGLAIVAAIAVWQILATRPVVVKAARVERGGATELVYATGYVEPEHPVTVSSRLTAPVAAVLVEEGEAVKRGQILVRLDDTQQQALFTQAQAQAQGQTLIEQRTATLYGQGWVTRAANDAAVASARAARAGAAAASAQLAQMAVRAGISGAVLKREVEPGDLATPGKALLELGDPTRVRVTATVDERDIPRVHVGQLALLSSDALPGQLMRGHVREITPGGDPDQRSFRVRIALDHAGDLPLGLTLEVNIVTRQRSRALLVPAAAIVEGHVWRIVAGRAKLRAAVIGIAGSEKVEVVSGLAEGDRVIVSPPDDLKDNTRVRE